MNYLTDFERIILQEEATLIPYSVEGEDRVIILLNSVANLADSFQLFKTGFWSAFVVDAERNPVGHVYRKVEEGTTHIPGDWVALHLSKDIWVTHSDMATAALIMLATAAIN